MAKEYGIRLNRKHPSAPKSAKGCIWVDESEDNYTTRDKAKRWKSKAAAKGAHMEPCDEVACLTPMAKALTRAQNELLAKAPVEWDLLPAGVGCTNMTLEALERAGLAELRLDPESERLSKWQWRKVPNAKVSGGLQRGRC